MMNLFDACGNLYIQNKQPHLYFEANRLHALFLIDWYHTLKTGAQLLNWKRTKANSTIIVNKYVPFIEVFAKNNKTSKDIIVKDSVSDAVEDLRIMLDSNAVRASRSYYQLARLVTSSFPIVQSKNLDELDLEVFAKEYKLWEMLK